jgi:thiol:disulfide interchange protein DsbD
MIRSFLLLLIVGSLAARASDPISAPAQGASATVSQPHVTAELIPETTSVQPGQPFDVILHLHSDPDWHTYWINPGDAGLATSIAWTLPPGFTAGPIQWPTPEKHTMGPEIIYGYAGDVYLLTTITPPKSDLPRHFDVKANAQWLVCQEECIPGKADLTLTLDSGLMNLRLPVENKDFFDQALERLPVPNTRWDVKAAYGPRADFNSRPAPEALNLELREKAGTASDSIKVHFFPEQSNVLATNKESNTYPMWPHGTGISLSISLQQNGEKPDKLSGVLISDQPLIGNAKAVYISEFRVASGVAAASPRGGSASPSGGPDNLLSGSSR